MASTPSLVVRPLAAADEARWRELFRAYRAFYRLEASEEVVSRVWGWLMDPRHECQGLIAETALSEESTRAAEPAHAAQADGGIVAIGHYRRFARPSTGSVGIWLDDLFTDPAARGRGAARALIARLADIAGAEGRSVVRWITRDDNVRAQAVYDQVATRTDWVTYDAAPGKETP